MSGGGVIRGPAGNNDCRIYVGNLPPDIRTKDIEDVFYKYGAIRDIDLKNRRGGPPFAFVEFEDPRIVKRRIEEDQINNGGHGMTPSAIVTDELGSIDLILMEVN
ncbi:UNVERIFIED_CONTAM: hypothetical protein H355_005955 [Colinus virginianus]|nr:hypothetical protein H355_005955 [Colinus virginianus]